MKNIIFLAPPAAGKGTFSDFLEKKYGYKHISTGKLFRERISIQDEKGKELEKIIKSGNLVNDDVLFALVKEKLKFISKSEKITIEGIPRTLQQAKLLDIILRDLNFSDYIVIYIQVEESTLIKRMTGRRICENCQNTYNIYFEKFKPKRETTCDVCNSPLIERIDDKAKTFKNRLSIFKENNEDIIKYYQEQNKLYFIDNTKEDQSEALKELQRIVGDLID